MKKKMMLLVAIIIIVAGVFWAKGYYNDRYVVSDSFYTQIPLDEVNEDSWLVDKDGVKQTKGKSYHLVAYNDAGEEREVSFSQKGTAKDYYAPGTYIKLNTSKTLVVGLEVVDESTVPQAALEKLRELGSKIN